MTCAPVEAQWIKALTENLGEEQLGAFLLRIGEEVFGGAHLDDVSRFHEPEAISDLASKTHFVSDDHHRHSPAVPSEHTGPVRWL